MEKHLATLAFVLMTSLLFFLSSSGVLADTQSFDASADAYVRSGSPNTNSSSGTILDLNDDRDGIIRFDVSAIPSGSTVTSATLTLVATAVGSASAVKNYGVHQILVNWTEGTVTWNTPGSTAGTHYATSPTVTTAVSTAGSYNWDVTGDVANFVSGSATNYGWRVIWSSNTSGSSKQVDFGAKEHSTSGNRPVLSVTYTTSDTTAPADVSNLALSSATPSSMLVSWTAPGDDNSTGTATTYDLRYSTSAITSGNFSSATQVSGEPTPSVAGSSESMTVSGLSPNTTYYFALKTSDEVPNTSTISNVPSISTSADETPNISIQTNSGTAARSISISGQAYPGSVIQVLRKSDTDVIYTQLPIKDSIVNPNGTFSYTSVGLLGGDYLFGLNVKDKNGIDSGTLSFVAELQSKDFLVATDILVQPTLAVKSATVTKGQMIDIFGYSAPGSSILIEFDSKNFATSTALLDGSWKFATTTGTLSLNNHFVRVRQVFKDRVSNYSLTKTVKITLLNNPRADLNGDNVINIKDWSIFLSRWGSTDVAERKKNDIDADGVVSITDFSAFLRAIQL